MRPRAVAVVLLLTLVAGCTNAPSKTSQDAAEHATTSPAASPQGDESTPQRPGDWSEQLASALQPGAPIDAESRIILASSGSTGVVTPEQVAMAAQATVRCVESAGMTVVLTPPADPYTGYGAELFFEASDGTEAETVGRAGEACLDRNLFAVEALYLTQPQAIDVQEAAADARFAEYRASLAQCLVDAGHRVDAEADRAELAELLALDVESRGLNGCSFSTGYMS